MPYTSLGLFIIQNLCQVQVSLAYTDLGWTVVISFDIVWASERLQRIRCEHDSSGNLQLREWHVSSSSWMGLTHTDTSCSGQSRDFDPERIFWKHDDKSFWSSCLAFCQPCTSCSLQDLEGPDLGICKGYLTCACLSCHLSCTTCWPKVEGF